MPKAKDGLAARLSAEARDAHLTKQINDLERRLQTERSDKSRIEKELRRVQDENSSVSQRLELLTETSDKFQQSKLHKLSKTKSKSTATVILCANDWHAEECVEKDVVGGVNEFNLDIAAKRIARTWEKAIYLRDFASHISNISDLVLWLGGDLVNNHLHEEAAEKNFLGPSEAILWVQDRVAEGITQLMPHFKNITVVTSYGNHGRTTKKRRLSTGYRHSWEWLAYQNLSRHFAKEPKVAWKIERGYMNWLDIQGRSIMFHHGDAVKYHGGIGGLHIPLRRKLAQWNKTKRADLSVCGHFHEYIDDYRYVVSGCLVGHNAYAIEIGAEFQEPSQCFAVIDREHGKVLAMPIFCEAVQQ